MLEHCVHSLPIAVMVSQMIARTSHSLIPGRRALQPAVQRRLGNRVGDFQADDLVLRLDFLRAHEHALIAVGELGLGENFADRRLHVHVPDVDADSLAGERADQAFDLFGPAFHSDFFAEIRARTNLIRRKPRHAQLAVLEVHRPQNRVVIAREHRDGVAHDEGGAEMVAIACQVAGILGAKHKQRVQIGIVQRVLGALQTFAQHPLRIKSHFPINWNHSNIGHEFFSSENISENPLVSFVSEMSNL